MINEKGYVVEGSSGNLMDRLASLSVEISHQREMLGLKNAVLILRQQDFLRPRCWCLIGEVMVVFEWSSINSRIVRLVSYHYGSP